VLLSTYNGARFVSSLLQSVVNQDYDDFVILVRDDGSGDETVDIIADFGARYPDKVQVINDSKGNLGVRQSFDEIMMRATAAYCFFCDQDDIWKPEKIRIMTRWIEEEEGRRGDSAPIVAFSDMSLIDSRGRQLKPSYLAGGWEGRTSDFPRGLFKGVISGCVTAFNAAAREAYLMTPADLLHDYHMLMTAFLHGRLCHIPRQLIEYRIHGDNYLGTVTKAPLRVEFKDLAKYLFRNQDYRSIRLGAYYRYVDSVRTSSNSALCAEKKLYSREEVEALTYLQRKRWFLEHFIPFDETRLRAFIQLALA